MNSDIARAFVVYLPSFKGNETIIISCNNAGLQSLIRGFERLTPRKGLRTAQLIIGDRLPILSDGQDVVTVMVRNHQPVTVSRDSGESFLWKMDWEDHVQLLQKLRTMREYGRPCHQYFDPEDALASSPVILVSLLEYEDDELRGMKDDEQSEMMPSDRAASHQHDN